LFEDDRERIEVGHHVGHGRGRADLDGVPLRQARGVDELDDRLDARCVEDGHGPESRIEVERTAHEGGALLGRELWQVLTKTLNGAVAAPAVRRGTDVGGVVGEDDALGHGVLLLSLA
jgi:hypothetical protein